MDAVERKGLAYLHLGEMASVEEAISILGDEGQSIRRRCLAAKAVYLLGDLEERGAVMRWVREPVLGGAILWAHRRRFERRKRQGVALEEWLTALAVGPDMNCYWDAAGQIGSSGIRRATRPVMRIVRESNEPNRRAAALHALWLLDDPRATPLLLRVAADPVASEKERYIAVEALGVTAHRPHVQRALARYLSDPLPMVRYSALCAVGAMWVRGEVPGPALREALRHATLDSTRVYEDGDVARRAAELLTPMRIARWRETPQSATSGPPETSE